MWWLRCVQIWHQRPAIHDFGDVLRPMRRVTERLLVNSSPLGSLASLHLLLVWASSAAEVREGRGAGRADRRHSFGSKDDTATLTASAHAAHMK
jgi:hypothetical protein